MITDFLATKLGDVAGDHVVGALELLSLLLDPGFGGTASYDSTLNGKVLDLAIREAVNNLVNGIETGAWRPAQ